MRSRLEDTTNPTIDPRDLKAFFVGSKLQVQVKLDPQEQKEFAQFCEPRAQVVLWNTQTGENGLPSPLATTAPS